jgi:hypothetical protein
MILIVEYPIAGKIFQQDKLFEKPCRMCKMPLGGTRAGHRLNNKILGFQRVAKSDRRIANLPVPVRERGQSRNVVGSQGHLFSVISRITSLGRRAVQA